MKNRIFAGIRTTGISYADRDREENDDFKPLAFLDFSTLSLAYAPGCPHDLRREISIDAAKIQARRGEFYEISACGQGVILGSLRKGKREVAPKCPSKGLRGAKWENKRGSLCYDKNEYHYSQKE